MEIAYEKLIKDIFEYEHGDRTNLSTTQLVSADEIDAINTYSNLVYRINQITEANYNDMHYKLHNVYYDVFTYIDFEIDTERMYQLIICNNYYQVYRFNQKDYNTRKVVCEFSMPGKVYTFYSGTVIIVVGKGCNGIEYKEITT